MDLVRNTRFNFSANFIKRVKIGYEVFMAILALVSVIFLFNETNLVKIVDKVIWLIFVLDVSYRFFTSKNKIQYLKKNPLDIIAIIPLDSIFRLARLARLVRLARTLVIFKHYTGHLNGILKTNSLDKVLIILVLVIFTTSIPIRYLEPSITTYTDAVWWAIVTATTVGYGDISPETIVGRLIAVFLMVFGIGLLGLVTSSVATYFLKNTEKEEDTTIIYLKSQLDRIEELSEQEIDRMIVVLNTYKKSS
ncbi:potassium channel family protein [Bacillus sp. FJAT-45066]|uniref:potassium channel family protein n=1 Tax=Bacillus sp. FJAT-45066 TaxID=2011010 RepID=UPI0020D0A0C6|nr:potassium channel family protein [Bacillus sp. FJAT-45066]